MLKTTKGSFRSPLQFSGFKLAVLSHETWIPPIEWLVILVHLSVFIQNMHQVFVKNLTHCIHLPVISRWLDFDWNSSLIQNTFNSLTNYFISASSMKSVSARDPYFHILSFPTEASNTWDWKFGPIRLAVISMPFTVPPIAHTFWYLTIFFNIHFIRFQLLNSHASLSIWSTTRIGCCTSRIFWP